MADESKLVENIVFGPFERVNYIVYEIEEKMGMGDNKFIGRWRITEDRKTGKIIYRTYVGRKEPV